MEFIVGINVNQIRSDLIDYALSTLYKKQSLDNSTVVTAICQRWQNQSEGRRLSPDQFKRLRHIAYQATGIAREKYVQKTQLNLF